MLLNKVIGISLKAARIRQDLTLRDLSRLSNVAVSYLSQVERGQKEPSSTVVESILSGLGLDLAALLRDCYWRVSESIVDPFSVDEYWDWEEIETRHELQPT